MSGDVTREGTVQEKQSQENTGIREEGDNDDHPRKKRRAEEALDDNRKPAREYSGKPATSSAGSSGEEADIDTSSGGSSEFAARKKHKARAEFVCKDGHVPPAVQQHEGDCMVANRLLALWNATPNMHRTRATGQARKVGTERKTTVGRVAC